MPVCLPDLTDFCDIARRGLYGYDWQDATRKARKSGCYEIVSRPLQAIQVKELPPELRQLAELVRFGELRFADSDSICVGSLLECVRGFS
jgi:hypothetical protein